MVIPNCLVLSQVIAYIVSLVLSFLILVPLAVNQREFNGHCLLYATGQWATNQSGGVAELQHVTWGSSSTCGFNIFMGVLLMFLSLLYSVLFSYRLINHSDSTWLEAFIASIVCCTVTALLLVSSLLLTLGFHKWCLLITSKGSGIAGCKWADFIPFSEDIGVNTSNFFSEMAMAEFGSWTSMVCWIFLSVVAMIKLFKYRRHEPFFTSMSRERERLLRKVGRQRDDTM